MEVRLTNNKLLAQLRDEMNENLKWIDEPTVRLNSAIHWWNIAYNKMNDILRELIDISNRQRDEENEENVQEKKG